jgi:Spy/CpxP family protein refolding chaperone
MRYAILLALIATTLIAQPAPPHGGPQQGPPPQAILDEVLQLSDAQVAAIEQLNEKRRSTVEPIAQQIGTAQQALNAALNAASPDATAVGRAMLTVRDLQRQIEQAQKSFADGFNALLTDSQRTQVQQIRNVEAALHAAQALHALGL